LLFDINISFIVYRHAIYRPGKEEKMDTSILIRFNRLLVTDMSTFIRVNLLSFTDMLSVKYFLFLKNIQFEKS